MDIDKGADLIEYKGEYAQVWKCPAPVEGVRYRVLQETWDYTAIRPIRFIQRIELVSGD